MSNSLAVIASHDKHPHSRGVICPSLAKHRPRKEEGAGKTGCPVHPQPRVRK